MLVCDEAREYVDLGHLRGSGFQGIPVDDPVRDETHWHPAGPGVDRFLADCYRRGFNGFRVVGDAGDTAFLEGYADASARHASPPHVVAG